MESSVEEGDTTSPTPLCDQQKKMISGQFYGIVEDKEFTFTGSKTVHPGAASSGHMNEGQK